MQPTAPIAASPPTRFVGLDIHKHYFVATGVNVQQEIVLSPVRVPNSQLHAWIAQHLTKQDAVVVEMTTNTYTFYDALQPLVYSVTVVHPPHVALIVRAQVKTDQKDALALARLHAAGLLTSIWIPPQPVRDLRALLAERYKLVRLSTLAKNRLQNVLHRHHFDPPPGSQPCHPKHRTWWLSLPLNRFEQLNVACDWEMLETTERLKLRLEEELKQVAGADPRVPLLVQVPGLSVIGALTILAAIGDIHRFPSAAQLVGYAGLGARVHASGERYQTGRITKTGRKDLRYLLVEAAQHAVRAHPKWKHVFARLAPRLGRSKAVVAIARKLLVVVWHLLTEETADRYSDPQQVARTFYAFYYKVGAKHMPPGLRALAYTRQQLDRLGIGQELQSIRWGRKLYKLPPSTLPAPDGAEIAKTA